MCACISKMGNYFSNMGKVNLQYGQSCPLPTVSAGIVPHQAHSFSVHHECASTLVRINPRLDLTVYRSIGGKASLFLKGWRSLFIRSSLLEGLSSLFFLLRFGNATQALTRTMTEISSRYWNRSHSPL